MNRKTYQFRAVILFIFVFFGVSCYLAHPWKSSIPVNLDQEIEPQSAQTLPFSVKSIKLKEKLNFDKAAFYDEEIGYGYSNIEGRSVFFKTLDGGRSWSKSGSISDVMINDLLIVNATKLLVISSRLFPSTSILENSCEIKVSNDGGQTWTNNFATESCFLQKVKFRPENTIIAVGQKKGDEESPTAWRNFIVISEDNGESWNNSSKNLNDKIDPQKSDEDKGLTDVYFSENGAIRVLSVRGGVFASEDGGRTWKIEDQVMNEPAQTSFNFFRTSYNYSSIIIGTSESKEGYWSVISRSEKSKPTHKYRLRNALFNDVSVISANKLLACGYEVPAGNGGNGDRQKNGAIWFSNDGGATWQTVCKSALSESFTSIAEISNTKSIITGNGSEVIIIETK